MGLFSCSIPPSFVLSRLIPVINTTSNWLCSDAFLSLRVTSLRIYWPLTTDHSSRATGHYSLATRHNLPPSAGTSGVRSCADPPPRLCCLTPTADLSETERGPISTNGLYISMSQNQAIPAEKSNRCSLLAAVGPLTILSRPETLNASGSRRACPMAIRRNARSLLDFPEFAQAVRYGVPGTPHRGLSSRSDQSR